MKMKYSTHLIVRSGITIATSICLLLSAFSAQAQSSKTQFSERILQPAGETAEHDSFGSAVAIGGNTMVIGAENGDGNEVGAGAAYIFDKIGNNWVQTAKLFADDGKAEPVPSSPGDFRSDSFGLTVAISADGNTVIAGAPAHNHNGKMGNAGAVYVFHRADGVWTQQAELLSPFPNSGDHFGDAPDFGGIAISGNTIAVTDQGTISGTLPGAVDLFTLTNRAWTFTGQLFVPDDPFFFPSSLAFDGNTLAVGSDISDAPTAFEAGVVYVFQFKEGQWSAPATLVAADATSLAQFGFSVSVDGNSVAVGAVAAPGDTAAAGTAYVFTSDDGVWRQKAELIATDGEDFDNFGASIAIDGKSVLVGAYNHTPPATGAFSAGAVYVFQLNDERAQQVAELSASDGISGSEYGLGVAIRDHTLLIGAPGQHPPVEGYPGGEGYLYKLQQ